MNRRVAWIVVAAALTSLLFASVSTSGGVDLWIEPQWSPSLPDVEPAEIDIEAREVPIEQLTANDDGSALVIPDWVQAVLRVLLATAGIMLAVLAVVTAWRRRPRLRWRRLASGDGDFEVLPDVASAIVDDAATQRSLLNRGTPRNAIVQCWLRLEHEVADVGLPRRPADTSVEFTERVLARYSVEPGAIHELAALYREARFSEHALDESARRAALVALDQLHESLAIARDRAAGNPVTA